MTSSCTNKIKKERERENMLENRNLRKNRSRKQYMLIKELKQMSVHMNIISD